jgi:hypothetical protein
VLLTQWIWLPVTAAGDGADPVGRGRPPAAQNRRSGILAAVPAVYVALPYNVVDFYPYPGTDAFGIYNRHGAHLIYLVAATVLFVRGPVIQTVAAQRAALLALAFCKITAFLAAGPILLFGLVLGRIRLIDSGHATALACLGVAGVAEVVTTVLVVPLRSATSSCLPRRTPVRCCPASSQRRRSTSTCFGAGGVAGNRAPGLPPLPAMRPLRVGRPDGNPVART